ncbi:MAG: twin-arginine translocation signal domain-containing protein [Dehalococcoidia bacterium]|nr:MAG: twin-arginine translocation signal domain-containing protein [Dehalococcoidia bacterium]
MPQKRVSRREFLRGTGVLLAAAAAGSPGLLEGCFGVPGRTSSPPTSVTQLPGIIYSPDTLRANRIPPGQTETSAWPQLQASGVPTINLDDWIFTISGEVEKEVILSYGEFTALLSEKVFSDIHCVTRWTRLNNLWEGFGAQTVTNLVKLKTDAKFVIVHAYGGFTTNLTLSDFLQPDVLFTVKHDGTPLIPEHGWPVRLVVPRLYFWKSAKWVTGIEFSAVDQPGFWETRRYNNHGGPWKEERFS